jgi:hypothetical protein
VATFVEPERDLRVVQRAGHSLKLFTLRNIQAFILDAAKFAVLLVLGVICTVFSIICLPSIGLGIALLSEQVATWSRTSQWHPVPLAALLHYPRDVHWLLVQSAIEQLLSLESGVVLIVLATLIWTIVLVTFDRALKKWRPGSSIF